MLIVIFFRKWSPKGFAMGSIDLKCRFQSVQQNRRSMVIIHPCDCGVQVPTLLRMVPKRLRPARRAVSTTVRMVASPSAARIAR